jgi:hypothetical protein
MTYAAASWQRQNDFNADWNIPVRKIIQDLPKDTLKPDTSYSRYAAYSVAVKLADRQKT